MIWSSFLRFKFASRRSFYLIFENKTFFLLFSVVKLKGQATPVIRVDLSNRALVAIREDDTVTDSNEIRSGIRQSTLAEEGSVVSRVLADRHKGNPGPPTRINNYQLLSVVFPETGNKL